MSDANPYEVPFSEVEDLPEGEALELADRGTRLGAKILDGIFVGGGFAGIGMIAAILIPTMVSARQGGSPSMAGLYIAFGLGGLVILGVMIWNIFWLHRYGQTIAKRILKIRIVRSNGEPAGVGRILGLRIVLITVLESIPILGPLFSLVNVCFIFRDDRRCLHDLIADTMVVKVS